MTKDLQAIARAHEVFDALSRIRTLEHHIRQLVKNHDPTRGDNATRRDCVAFWKRLDELALTQRAKEKAV